jgi:(p)ppGpp synthase/HD superfamily hydrolase
VINQQGILAKLTHIIAQEKVNIVNVAIDAHEGRFETLKILIEIKNRLHLANLIRKIRLYDFVVKVYRHH